MEYSPTLCFAGFEGKINNSSKKMRKLAKVEMLRHNFIMSRDQFKVTNRVMSQQEMICCNKKEAELKLEVKIVATFHNFVAT